MIEAKVRLVSVSPYSQSAPIQSRKPTGENAEDFEQRTWRERIHADDDGRVFIPAQSFKISLAEAAKFLSKRVPGKGQATYTKHFEAGVMVLDNAMLPIRREEVKSERLFLNADGKRGGSKRVYREMPVIPKWDAEVTFYIFDDTINEETFREHLQGAGTFIGIGRWRPRNGGTKGRFKVESIEWKEKN